MNKIFEYLIVNLGTGLWTMLLVLGLYVVLTGLPLKVAISLYDRRDKRYELTQDLLNRNNISNIAHEYLTDALEKAAFKRYYGIKADSVTRDALFTFYRKNKHKLTWIQIRRAYPFIRIEETQVFVELAWYNHVFRWIVGGLSFITGLYAVLVFSFGLVVSYSPDFSTWKVVGLTASAMGVLVGAICFSSLNWPYHAARYIQKHRVTSR